jgi:hypothetical protein
MALVHCRGARFSASLAWALLLERRRAVTNHRAFRLPPDASRRQFDRPPLVRFCLFPSAYLAAPCRSKRPCLEPFRCGAFSMPAPTGVRFALAVFIASRFRFSAISLVETPPAQVIHGWLLFSRVPGSLIGQLSQPVRDFSSRRRSWDFSFPSQLSSASRVMTPLSVSNPHAVSPCAWPRVSSSRDPTKMAGSSSVWPRLLGFGPAKQPCRAICRPRYSFCA